MKRDYIPDAGDIVWMDFDPQAGGRLRKRKIKHAKPVAEAVAA